MFRLNFHAVVFGATLAVALTACRPSVSVPGNRTANEPAVGAGAFESNATAFTPASPTSRNTYAPVPTRDVAQLLLTQAYSIVTPAAAISAVPTSAPTQAHTATGASGAPAIASTGGTTGTSAITFSEPVLLSGATNTAVCAMKYLDTAEGCVSPTRSGADLYFTFTLGVQGSGAFRYGSAAVSVTRNGEPFQWILTSDTQTSAPDPRSNIQWSLPVGAKAAFRAGLDEVSAGQYVARLTVCTLTPDECAAGRGWQAVGGEAIAITITGE